MSEERFLAISNCSECAWNTGLLGKIACIHPVFQEKYKDDWKIGKLVDFPEIHDYNEIPEFCPLPKKIRAEEIEKVINKIEKSVANTSLKIALINIIKEVYNLI